MLYRPFGKLGWQVSAVGLGTWNIGNQWGEIDDATSFATVRRALDEGINLFDTADAYGIPHGLSEDRLGHALGRDRHRVRIVSKIGNWGKRTGQDVPWTTVDMIRLAAHACLGRLRCDYLDVLLCHLATIEDPSVFLEGFEALVAEGRLLAYGISTDNLDVLKRFNADGRCAVVEVNWSLINRAPEAEFLPYCAEQGIAVLVRGPLRQGLLSGKYTAASTFTDTVRGGWNEGPAREKILAELAQVEKLKSVVAPGAEMVTAALRYTLSHPAAPVTIPGGKSPEQVSQNAAAGERELTVHERNELLAALEG